MNQHHKQELIKVCTEDFFTNPNWDKVIQLIELYIEPLKSIGGIDTKGMTNDEIATELRSRQITVEQLKKFVQDTLTLQKNSESVQKNTRKFK
jgi:hypothetical protein